jgi:YegS/Rv2252/BmrU family lipid kinase
LLSSGRRYIVAAGGDGTLNEVLNGFFHPSGDDRLIDCEARLGVLPLGTGSDFCRSIGMHRREAALQALATGTCRLLDVGRADIGRPEQAPGRYFLNVADLGLGAEAAYRVNRSSKRLGAFVSYLNGAVQAIIAHHPQVIALQLDEQAPIEEPMGLVVVANSRFFGGGMPVVPHAVPDDGHFDVLWLTNTSRGRLLVDLLPKLYRGAHVRHPAVHFRPATSVRITCRGPLRLEADGELIGNAPASFRILPRILQVVAPHHTPAVS